jgi:hypothetical protein
MSSGITSRFTACITSICSCTNFFRKSQPQPQPQYNTPKRNRRHQSLVIIGERHRAAQSDKTNLCLKCDYYLSVEFSRSAQQLKVCTVINSNPIHLSGPVATCNCFYDKTAPSKHDMEKIAWTLELQKSTVGFAAEQVRFLPPAKKANDD